MPKTPTINTAPHNPPNAFSYLHRNIIACPYCQDDTYVNTENGRMVCSLNETMKTLLTKYAEAAEAEAAANEPCPA